MEDARSSDRLGESFATALAAKDVPSLRRILHPDVTFRALTPSRAWEARGLEEALGVLFDNWFEDHDHIEELISVKVGRTGGRGRIDYLLRVRSNGADYLVEQVAYFDDDSSRITWVSILCSGYRKLGVPADDPDRAEARAT